MYMYMYTYMYMYAACDGRRPHGWTGWTVPRGWRHPFATSTQQCPHPFAAVRVCACACACWQSLEGDGSLQISLEVISLALKEMLEPGGTAANLPHASRAALNTARELLSGTAALAYRLSFECEPAPAAC